MDFDSDPSEQSGQTALHDAPAPKPRTQWHWGVTGLSLLFCFLAPYVCFVMGHEPPWWLIVTVLAVLIALLPWVSWVCPVLDARNAHRKIKTTPRSVMRGDLFLVWSPCLIVGGSVGFVWGVVIVTQPPGGDMGGLIVMTIMAIVFGLIAWRVGRIIKRVSRRTIALRGLCFECGYDVRVSPDGPCPECGAVPGPVGDEVASSQLGSG